MKNLDLSTLPAKKRKQIVSCLRAGIQLLYFLFLPSVFTAAFNGVKYIFTQLGQGEKIEMTAFVSALLLVCAFTIVFGRFFCGFACAFGSLGDAMHAIYGIICKKRKKKPRRIKPELAKKLALVKYGILLLIALCCFAGVYQKARGTSPWDVFSMLHAGNFRLSSYIPGIVLLVLILVGMFFEERFFCRFLCPMGAVFSLLPILPSLLCTGNAKTASAAAAPARDSARQRWNCHPMDPWRSPATVSSARNVLIRVRKVISAAG